MMTPMDAGAPSETFLSVPKQPLHANKSSTSLNSAISNNTTSSTSTNSRPRWALHAQASMWRFLMEIGMVIHRMPSPRPPRYTFRRSIKSHFANHPGSFRLYFYCPTSWRHRKQDQKYPVVINFHGGGFTIGNARDDARWCDAVVSQVGAIVVSVDYRLAPEHPFPVGVKDGVETLLYLTEHANELGIDRHNFAVSGFSAGGNMAFSVPLRLQAEVRSVQKLRASKTDIHGDADSVYSGRECDWEFTAPNIKAIVAWYPSLDFTRPRPEREVIPSRPDLMMPKFFTDLFDASYLQPPTLDCSSPYLSPGVAPAELLQDLPDMIMMYPCEFDGLNVEAGVFRERLEKEAGKKVRWKLVPGVPHAWDKSPNPFRTLKTVDDFYRDACDSLREAFKMTPERARTLEVVNNGEEVQGDDLGRLHDVDEMGLKEDSEESDGN